MQDVLQRLTQMQRPSLLVQAAKIRAQSYRRKSDIPRILNTSRKLPTTQLLIHLMEKEYELNAQRIADVALYSAVDHIEVLAAVIKETDVLRAERSARRADGSGKAVGH